MDKIQTLSDSECYTPPSVPFRFQHGIRSSRSGRNLMEGFVNEFLVPVIDLVYLLSAEGPSGPQDYLCFLQFVMPTTHKGLVLAQHVFSSRHMQGQLTLHVLARVRLMHVNGILFRCFSQKLQSLNISMKSSLHLTLYGNYKQYNWRNRPENLLPTLLFSKLACYSTHCEESKLWIFSSATETIAPKIIACYVCMWSTLTRSLI
jgi:hypothetical protein